jgi:hypothetical protein
LDDGRNVLSRNIAIRTANTIKNSTKWQTVMVDDEEEEEESKRRSGRFVAFFIIGILPAEPAFAFSMV